jgi:acyl-coenzyme A synthetase/AMP-(fatty) acid ligase
MALRRKRKTDIPRAGPFPPGWDVPARFNFTRDVIESLAASDSRKGVAYVDTEGIVDRRTFADVAKDAARWAHLLRTRLDRGDRVLVVLGKVPAWHGAMLGALKGGLVAVPCSDMLRARDLAHRVRDSGARLVVADRSGEDEVEEMANQVEGGVTVIYLDEALSELQRYVPRAPTEETTAGESALILYTSGTTKEPKGVVHTHAYTWAQRAQAGHWLDAHEQDVVWCTAGTGWAKSIWNVLLGPWSHGAEVVVHEGAFDAEQRLSLLERLGVTVLCQAPTEYRMMAKLDALGKAHLPRLRHAVSAGEPLNPEVIERFQDVLGLTIHDGYGQTENSLLVANAPGAPVRPGSMGLPTPGHDVEVIDESGHICPPGVEGEIALIGKPPTLFAGYWNNRDETNAMFRDGWYLTGDRATRDEEGYLWFVGRGDDVILSAAYRIGPFEVESALLEHPAVAESAVVGVPHAERGQIVKAFVVLRPGHEADGVLATELQDHVKAITAPYKYPRAIEFVDELPKTASGKIRRSELRARPHVDVEIESSVLQLPVKKRDEAAEERARAEAEEAARIEAEEAARVAAAAAAEAVRREAEERARREAAEAALREAEARARAEAEAAAQKEREEVARLEALAASRRAEEERERAAAEGAAAREAEEARLSAEAEEAARLEAEAEAERLRAEAEEAARLEAEAEAERLRVEAEAAARLEAEAAAAAAAVREAEERARAEAAAQRDAEEAAQREAEEAAQREAEEALRRDAEERSKAETDQQAAAQAEEIARVEAEIATFREAAERRRLEARAAEAMRLAREAEMEVGAEPEEVDDEWERLDAEAAAQQDPDEVPLGRLSGGRAARREAREAAKAEKQRQREEAERAKREAEEAKRRAKEDAELAKQRAKDEARQAKLDAEAAAQRARDNAASAERRAKEEEEQRKRDEAAAREEALRLAEEARERDREEKRKKSRSELGRFLFGGEEPDEFTDDEQAPMAPIPGLVERLQRYSGQETIPPPPDQLGPGRFDPPPQEPPEPDTLVDENGVSLIKDEESRSH